METDVLTLNSLFVADVRYVVPRYQRAYVWNQDRHWEPLWEDVELLVERHMAGTPIHHFLGAIVLQQELTQPGEVPRHLVIDGQQRLATLQVLLAAAVNGISELEPARSAHLLSRLIYNDAALASGDERFKVWPTEADRNAFRRVMQPNGPRTEVVPEDGANSVHEAYAFFADRVRTWLGGDDVAPEKLPIRSDALRIVIAELLQVVSISLGADDDPQVIFETLNARGTPLLAMDLVKNSVFLRLSLNHEDTAVLHDEVWQPELGRVYWSEETGPGRLARPRAEFFLLHWLTMKLGQTVRVTDLFPVFRTHLLDSPGAPDPADLVRELCSDAAVMRSFDELPADTEAGRFFRLLSTLSTTVFHPLALLLFRSTAVSPDRRDRALHALQSYLVRRMIMGMNTRGYSVLGVDLVKAALDNLDQADKQVAVELARSAATTRRWPLDDEVRQQILHHPLFGYVSRQRLAMLFSEIELDLRSGPKTEDVALLQQSLSIEHIMPQSWEENWPLADSSEETLERRISLLGVLGNLTIVTGPLNSSLSNQGWGDKKERLTHHSVLLLNQELAALDTWDEKAILDRGNLLADRILALWPGPEHFDSAFDPTALRAPVGELAPENVMPPEEVPEVFESGTPLFRELLSDLAQHPDERRTYANVEASLGWPKGRLASVLGGYYSQRATRFGGRRPYRIYGEADGTWWIWMDKERAMRVPTAVNSSGG